MRLLQKKAQRNPERSGVTVRREREQVTRLHPVLSLHQTAGNQTAARMIQAKLKVSRPGDMYEREADRMAELAMRMPELIPLSPAAVSTSSLQRKCDECSSGQGLCNKCAETGDMEESVQSKVGSSGTSAVSASVESRLDSLRGGGEPLVSPLRAFFEPRFGYDLSQVRVHTDAHAAQLARNLNARAFTLSRDIVFAAGEYSPHTAEGQRLLAHELAHVTQQSAGQAPMIARQFDLPGLDVCVETELGTVCGSDAKAVCEKVPNLPGCNQVCKLLGCKKPDKPGAQCPPGFRAATSDEFKGQCCRGTADNKKDCCPPDRAAWKDFRCCGEGEFERDGHCVKVPPPPTPCFPPERGSPDGLTCCPPDQIWDRLQRRCVSKSVTPPTPPPRPLPTAVEIFFQKDRPRPGDSGDTALNTSLTGEGRGKFDELVKQLKGNPALRVQLLGRASPEGTDEYNSELAKRRAELIAERLEAKGIDPSRIANPPDNDLISECLEVRSGIFGCGEAGASGQQDRQVLARVFPMP